MGPDVGIQDLAGRAAWARDRVAAGIEEIKREQRIGGQRGPGNTFSPRTNYAPPVMHRLISGPEKKTCVPIAIQAGLGRAAQFFISSGKSADEALMTELARPFPGDKPCHFPAPTR